MSAAPENVVVTFGSKTPSSRGRRHADRTPPTYPRRGTDHRSSASQSLNSVAGRRYVASRRKSSSVERLEDDVVESKHQPGEVGSTPVVIPSDKLQQSVLISHTEEKQTLDREKKHAHVHFRLITGLLWAQALVHLGAVVGYLIADITLQLIARAAAYAAIHFALACGCFAALYMQKRGAKHYHQAAHFSHLALIVAANTIMLVSMLQSCLHGPFNGYFGHCSSRQDSFAVAIMAVASVLLANVAVIRARGKKQAWCVVGLIAVPTIAVIAVFFALANGTTTTNFVAVLLMLIMAQLLMSTSTAKMWRFGRHQSHVPGSTGLSPTAALRRDGLPEALVADINQAFEEQASRLMNRLREVSHAISALSQELQLANASTATNHKAISTDIFDINRLADQLRALIESWNGAEERGRRSTAIEWVLRSTLGIPTHVHVANAAMAKEETKEMEHVVWSPKDAVIRLKTPPARYASSSISEVKPEEQPQPTIPQSPSSQNQNWLLTTAAEHLIHHAKCASPIPHHHHHHSYNVVKRAQSLPFDMSSDPNLVAKAVQQTLLQRYASARSPMSETHHGKSPRMSPLAESVVRDEKVPIAMSVASPVIFKRRQAQLTGIESVPNVDGAAWDKQIPAPLVLGPPALSSDTFATPELRVAAAGGFADKMLLSDESLSPLSWSSSEDDGRSVDSKSSSHYCSTCGESLESSEEYSSEGEASPTDIDLGLDISDSTKVAVGGTHTAVAEQPPGVEHDTSRPDDTYAFDYGFEHEYGHKYGKQRAKRPFAAAKSTSMARETTGSQSSAGPLATPLSASLGVAQAAPTLVHGRLTDASAVILGVPETEKPTTSASAEHELVRTTSQNSGSDHQGSAHSQKSIGTADKADAASEPQFHFGLHVLVVDDERVNRRIAERYLKQLGCTCDCVADGDEIVEALVVSERPFDVILLDVIMKRTNGLEVCKSLREQHVDIPIIAATAAYSHKEAAIYKAAGFDRVLQKPFSMKELASALAQALGIQIGRGAALNYSVIL